MTNQTGYIVYATDSVGTALGEIDPGAIRLLGEPGDGHVTAVREDEQPERKAKCDRTEQQKTVR